MPAKDIIHDTVKTALENDGWLVTHDPYIIRYERLNLYADLGAEQMMAIERQGNKIVVEVKSFLEPSLIQGLKIALGQYDLYRGYLEVTAPDRKLYLALGHNVYQRMQQQKAIMFILERYEIPLIVVDLSNEEIIEWIR